MMALPADREDVTVHEMTRDEARALFDREARRQLGMSGDEFLRAYEAGAFDHEIERTEVMRVIRLLPFGQN